MTDPGHQAGHDKKKITGAPMTPVIVEMQIAVIWLLREAALAR